MSNPNVIRLDLAIETIPTTSLKADPLNPRTHPPRQIKAVAHSMRKFGFVVPC